MGIGRLRRGSGETGGTVTPSSIVKLDMYLKAVLTELASFPRATSTPTLDELLQTDMPFSGA